ncbi:phosphomannomutase [Thetidibacter halocola]|uniref:Phosphomannomutase n=1 Tax=Thetidibacter halocola TaxID=2827239 RepID=A0A8J8B5Y0_9RHOB|nr:phosphomannomutase [Thetidibacter halocola]MBS0123406.1 phosphomannomutase [Thetidibacter halocola]
MAPKFGTSGLRGLVVELTPDLVADHVRAFQRSCPVGSGLFVGQDLRPSSPGIAATVMGVAEAEGVAVTDCGVLPTPALALAAMQAGAGAVMITGSHIPADRNGLKFYTPEGEITKAHEGAILASLGTEPSDIAGPGRRTLDASGAYAARYVQGFGPGALAGLRIGVYQHSSVARDVMAEVVAALGAEPVALARSDIFIPVDTEAVDPETRAMLAAWCAEHGLDAVISTDGDADRPMLSDASGRLVPGDVLGALTAQALGAEVICTPVSSNTQVDGLFGRVIRTRIGSPYVIAAMEAVLAETPSARVVGYEPNGGFLLGFEARGMAPLLTRDCLLPMLAPLAEAQTRGLPLADLVAGLPPRFTAADRLQGIAPETAASFIAGMAGSAEARAAFFETMPAETALDLTDGLRVTFAGGEILHLRASGNAPEFRCYAEADSTDLAVALVAEYLERLHARLG